MQLEDKASGAARWLFQMNSFSLHVLFAEEASIGMQQREKICVAREAVGYNISELGSVSAVGPTADWCLLAVVWPHV